VANWLPAAGKGGVCSLWRLMVICPRMSCLRWGAGRSTALAPGGVRCLAVARGARDLDPGTARSGLAAAACAVQASAVMALELESHWVISWLSGTGQGVCIWALPPGPQRKLQALQLETASAVLHWCGASIHPWLVRA